MKREARAGVVAIEQTGIGGELREPASLRSRTGQLEKYRRHRRPRPAVQRIARVVAIATAVAHPTQAAAIGHGHRHATATLCRQMTKGRGSFDVFDGRQQCRHAVERESPEQPGTRHESFVPGVERISVEQITRMPLHVRSSYFNCYPIMMSPLTAKMRFS